MANLFLTSGLFMKGVYQVLLFLDGMVYWLIDMLYTLLMSIANTQLFSASTYAEFATRIYAILGIVMLFIVAFQLLTMIVDPEKITSGDMPASKIALNIVLTIVILTLLPTGFKYLYRFQQVVVSENIIGKILIGDVNESDSTTNSSNVGKNIAVIMYDAFIYPLGFEGNANLGCQTGVVASNFCPVYLRVTNPTNETDYGVIFRYNTSKIRKEIDDGEVQYMGGLSLIAGGFVCYLLISFCIDLGVRVIKLAYFQLVAPVPVAMRIIPKQNTVFDNWLKGLTKTYLDLFIRLLIIFLCVYLINLVPDAINNVFASNQPDSAFAFEISTTKIDIIKIFTQVAIIFGILLFMKEAPKLISSMFNLGDASLQIGIGKKLGEMPLFGKDQALNPAKLSKSAAEARGRNYQNRVLRQEARADGAGWYSRAREVGRHNRGQESLEARDLRRAHIEERKANAQRLLELDKSIDENAEAIAKHRNYKQAFTAADGKKFDNKTSYYGLVQDLEAKKMAGASADELTKAQGYIDEYLNNSKDAIKDTLLSGENVFQRDSNGNKMKDSDGKELLHFGNQELATAESLKEVNEMIKDGKVVGVTELVKDNKGIKSAKAAAKKDNYAAQTEERKIKSERGAAAKFGKDKVQKKPGSGK